MSAGRAPERRSRSRSPSLPTDQPMAADPGAIRLLLVDDHPMWRETLRKVFEDQDDMVVVAETADGARAVALTGTAEPDVVLMDIDLPALDGVAATRLILADHPDVKVMILSATDQKRTVLAAVQAGAIGYLVKTAESREVVDAVRRIHRGEPVFPPS